MTLIQGIHITPRRSSTTVKKRHLVALSASLLFAGAFAAAPVTAPPVEAASCVSISRVYFDSPGSDTGSNTSLNAEYIQLKNRCSTGKSLSGYTIKDAANHTYRFGTYTLRAGSTVKVHTGRGSNTAANRYWQQTWYIWNNTGDKAVLRTSGGTVVDSCSFTGAGDSVYC